MKNPILFSLVLLFTSCGNPTELEEKIKTLESDLSAAHTKLAEAEAKLAEINSPGLTHSVFFWLKKDLSEANEAAFLEGLKSLGEVASVQSTHIGPPAPTEARGVVDNTFSYALLVGFENAEGEAAYQVDPIHLKFIEDHKDKWDKVVVYDNLNQ